MLFDSVGFKSADLKEEAMGGERKWERVYFAKFKSNLTFFFE
jgi:hypothetical protein